MLVVIWPEVTKRSGCVIDGIPYETDRKFLNFWDPANADLNHMDQTISIDMPEN